MGATICKTDKAERISLISPPNKKDCKNDNIKKCTISYRLSVAAKTAAHEIGHNLGMDHDFNTKIYQQTKKFQYRKYKNKKCFGFMSYGKNRNGWSACSARDFSRYLTTAGTKKPCLNYKSKSGKGTSKGTTTSTTATTCKNICPGSGCQVTPNTICNMVKVWGSKKCKGKKCSCKGMYANLLNNYCKKSCGKC